MAGTALPSLAGTSAVALLLAGCAPRKASFHSWLCRRGDDERCSRAKQFHFLFANMFPPQPQRLASLAAAFRPGDTHACTRGPPARLLQAHQWSRVPLCRRGCAPQHPGCRRPAPQGVQAEPGRRLPASGKPLVQRARRRRCCCGANPGCVSMAGPAGAWLLSPPRWLSCSCSGVPEREG